MFTNPDMFALQAPSADELISLGDVGEFFACLIDFLYADLVKQGIKEEVANKVVGKVVVNLSQAFSGESFYVTKQPVTFAKQMAMYNDLKRMTHKEVDKKHGVSYGYSLKVKKQIDDMRFNRKQLTLFET